MKPKFEGLALVLILLLLVPISGSGVPAERAKEQERESSDGADQLRQQIRAERADPNFPETFRLRARAMAESNLPPARSAAAYGTDDAMEDLWALATEIQELYDLRSSAVPESQFRRDVENRSKRLLNTTDRVLGFVDREGDGESVAPVLIPAGTFEEGVEQLMREFRQLIDPTVRLIAGDVLDLDLLDEARAGFATMQALILTLPEFRLRATTR